MTDRRGNPRAGWGRTKEEEEEGAASCACPPCASGVGARDQTSAAAVSQCCCWRWRLCGVRKGPLRGRERVTCSLLRAGCLSAGALSRAGQGRDEPVLPARRRLSLPPPPPLFLWAAASFAARRASVSVRRPVLCHCQRQPAETELKPSAAGGGSQQPTAGTGRRTDEALLDSPACSSPPPLLFFLGWPAGPGP